MKAATHPAWMLLPGDVLDGEGLVVSDCVSIAGTGRVWVTFTDGSERPYDRMTPVSVNSKG